MSHHWTTLSHTPGWNRPHKKLSGFRSIGWQPRRWIWIHVTFVRKVCWKVNYFKKKPTDSHGRYACKTTHQKRKLKVSHCMGTGWKQFEKQQKYQSFAKLTSTWLRNLQTINVNSEWCATLRQAHFAKLLMFSLGTDNPSPKPLVHEK